MVKKSFLIILIAIVSVGFLTAQDTTENRKKVQISTEYGDMVIELYNETPKHRDNFLKLVENGFYDSLLFHRVIENFMIQGGDPDSKNAPEGKRLGNGGPGYQIEAEFVEGIIHKKGALAAAREGDRVNPEKKSSGSQFYIVQGKVMPEAVMDKLEEKQRQRLVNNMIRTYIQDPENKEVKEEVDSLQQNKLFDELNQRFLEIENMLKEQPSYQPPKFSPLQREAYSTVGGTPHLDGSYTVFGQVVKGLNVIDSIAVQETDKFDRPVEDVMMFMEVVEEE